MHRLKLKLRLKHRLRQINWLKLRLKLRGKRFWRRKPMSKKMNPLQRGLSLRGHTQ
jgi:hypothetical protein